VLSALRLCYVADIFNFGRPTALARRARAIATDLLVFRFALVSFGGSIERFIADGQGSLQQDGNVDDIGCDVLR
jgi:hypothetical protein